MGTYSYSPRSIITLNAAYLCFVSAILHYSLPEDLLESIRVNMILTAGMMNGYCCIQEWCQLDSQLFSQVFKQFLEQIYCRV